ncbi:stage III sporulation protein AD [Oscillibacter valericigenes]|uniref:stage III sporulation AC/AD family protein n=1 Tax=Oscillibacter valericigenes TaxID=351091 RepID=UPI001F2ADD91|nr:stage III sporulation AC/AD family protein [Oscillibacter valericigenes]MCF2617331.1 stage III sporulation protein AD [Oscillibacter valericigenes]
MELASRVTALCVVGVILALVLKKTSPEQALLLVLCAAVAGLALLTDGLGELVEFLRELGERSGVSETLFVPLYKTVGIGLVAKVGGDLCRDAGGAALASVVETAGAVCALLVAMPLLRAVLELLMELMG